MEDERKACSTCGNMTIELALFPGGVCVDCYSHTYAATAPLTAESVSAMWGARTIRRNA